MTEKATPNFLHLVCTPQAPLPDKVAAVARGVFLKFVLILVFPMLILFCEADMGYVHQLTPSKIYCHSLTG